jgi:hypothetical protein
MKEIFMNKWIVLLENKKGQRDWFEITDLLIWANLKEGKECYLAGKTWNVIKIIEFRKEE